MTVNTLIGNGFVDEVEEIRTENDDALTLLDGCPRREVITPSGKRT
jgi:hypothetical protein